jgi:hypothetical protein
MRIQPEPHPFHLGGWLSKKRHHALVLRYLKVPIHEQHPARRHLRLQLLQLFCDVLIPQRANDVKIAQYGHSHEELRRLERRVAYAIWKTRARAAVDLVVHCNCDAVVSEQKG